MNDATIFYQKNGIVIMMLSRDLLNLAPGDRMLPIAEYEKRCGYSRWTIQTAIRFLLENGCMTIEKRGPKGTFVYELNYKKLWRFAGWDPLLGVMPAPTSFIHDGLLTGITDALNRAQAPFNTSFMVPASRRFYALSQKQCHFILTSKLAARVKREEFPKLETAVELKGARYCGGYCVYFRDTAKTAVANGMRVAVNSAAIEQSYLVELVCRGKEVERRYGNYHDCYNMFCSGAADALVYRSDGPAPAVPTSCVSLSYLGLDDEIVTPVLLVHTENYGMDRLLARSVDVSVVAAAQNEVLSHERMPRYY